MFMINGIYVYFYVAYRFIILNNGEKICASDFLTFVVPLNANLHNADNSFANRVAV